MYKRIFAFAAAFAAPAIAAAQRAGDTGTLGGTPLGNTLANINSLIQFFLGIALPLAIAFFFWGLIKFIKAGDSADLKVKGKNMMISSGIALFLMVGIWSVLGYVQKSVGLGSQGVDVAPAPSLNVVPGQ